MLILLLNYAIDPDKKRYVDSLKAPRHYLNIDHYGKGPFMKMPVKWEDAAKKYSADTLAKAYQMALKGMAARRMRSSILEVGSFWFSAG